MNKIIYRVISYEEDVYGLIFVRYKVQWRYRFLPIWFTLDQESYSYHGIYHDKIFYSLEEALREIESEKAKDKYVPVKKNTRQVWP